MLSRRLTKEEIIATIKHSSIPTVLVEGKDDIIFYRKLEEEEEFYDFGLDILSAGSKSAVLSIKKEIDLCPNNKVIAYIVDQDTWINFGVPDDINDVILTKGYSIENDLIEDYDLSSLLAKDELKTFNSEKERVIKWYALALNRNKMGLKLDNGEEACYQVHPERVLNDDFYTAQTNLYDNEEYPYSLYEDIKLNWRLKLRGKSLLALFLRQLSHRDRIPKHSNYSLMEHAVCKKGENYMRIVSALRERFVNNP